ncbi:hypothetical protein BH23ACT11_BH23ACT11_15420 [soil metagenome]
MRPFSILLLSLLLFSSAYAQNGQWQVFSAIEPASSGDLLALADEADGELERFAVTLDAAPLLNGSVQPGDQMQVLLPGGERTYRIQRIEDWTEGTRSVAAVAEDGSMDVIALTFARGGAVGHITSRDDFFHVELDPGGALLKRMDPAQIDELRCGLDHDHEVAPTPGGAGRAALEHTMAHFSMPSLVATLNDPITIDLLILYTFKAIAWADGPGRPGIEGVIAQSMNLSQLALDNSQTGIKLRLVHSRWTNYDEATPPPTGETGGASSWHLRRLTAGPTYNPWGANADGFMPEAHTLREEFGADLVTLFAEISDVGGIAWLLNSIGGRPEIGFSVNRVQQMGSTYTLVHEIGHNMGNAHGRDQPSATAGPAGGLFEYSVGWRFQGGNGSYNSVMSYGQPGDIRIAHFSNPEVLFDGVETGAMSGQFAPANAARSMREVKRAVASYRPTIVNPPTPAVGGSDLDVQTLNNGTATRTLTVSNSGTSELVWDLDFVSTTARGQLMLDSEISGEPVQMDSAPVPASANVSPSDVSADGDLLIIYETTFDSPEGFIPGTHGSIGGWSGSSNSGPVGISTDNPSTGLQHLRLPAAAPITVTTNFYSTYFGPWPAGLYEISFDLAVSEVGGSNYFILLQDSRTGDVVGGLRYGNNGSISTYDTGGVTIPGETWTPGVYRRATIVFDPMARMVRYELDGVPVASRPMAAGTSVGRFWIQRSTSAGSDVLDIDNVIYQSYYRGLEWLRASPMGGVVEPGGQQVVTLTFRGDEVDPGDYTANLVVKTNVAANSTFTVPVTLEVSTEVSGEGGPDARLTTLRGNYPNPFAGSTRIDYFLATPGHVTVEVFTVTGQRVAILADGSYPAGDHSLRFDTSDLASGVYIYRLRSGDTVDTRRMTVLR